MNDLVFRKATSADLPFLIEAVKAAEMLDTERCTYEKLFLLSSAELDDMLTGALSIDGSGYQLALSSFSIFSQRGLPVACCSSWVEAEDGISSGFKIASVLCDLLGFEKWVEAKVAIKAFADATPQRTPGALQMETFYVKPNSRGQGLTARIIDKVLSQFGAADSSIKVAEITMLEGNDKALSAYQKAGFSIRHRSQLSNEIFRTLTGSAGFLQLHKPI
jgi:GNAT superfamily N-acetyltransferase